MSPVNLAEYETYAQARMEPAAWDYYQGGSEDEVTLRANCSAFERIALRPRIMLRDDCACDLHVTVLGTPVAMPVLIAPTAFHRLAHADGECATARAAAEAGTVMVASSFSACSLETIAESSPAPLWFQLYMFRSRDATLGLIRRAEDAGYKAIALTVDTPRFGRRERDIRNGFTLPQHAGIANFAEENITGSYLPDPLPVTWEAIRWLRSVTKLPILLKGIVTAEDTALAVEHGIEGIIVSNHGGRQLDGAIATIEALPEVAQAAAGRCEIYLDGGIRRGTDILKALALGARAVLIGRPVLWGLAAGGADGVRHVLELLRLELEHAMLLSGRPAIRDIDPSLIRLR